MTFSEAREFCKNLSIGPGRVPTKTEAYDQCVGKHRGTQTDTEWTWTSDSCDDGNVIVVKGEGFEQRHPYVRASNEQIPSSVCRRNSTR